MIFYRLLPIAAFLALVLYLEARRKSGVKPETEVAPEPDATDESSKASEPASKTPPPLPKSSAAIHVEVEVPSSEIPPPEAPQLSKPLREAMDHLSAEQSQAFLALLNQKPATALQEIPGVGASMAEKIMAGRPYTSAADLLGVSGIGERRLIEFLAWAGGQ